MLKIKIIKVEFTLTDENPCDGELEYSCVDNSCHEMTIREFLEYLQRNGATWHASSTARPLGAYDWLSTEYQVSLYTQDWIEMSMHCADTNNEKRWQRYVAIADKLGLFM